MFHADFRQILTNTKDEPVGAYIARVREALDKFYAHHGDKIYTESLPRAKKLLGIKDAKSPNEKEYNSFAFPTDSATRVANIVDTILSAVPEENREDFREVILPVMETVNLHFEEGCHNYLRQFIKESKGDFLFFAKSRYEWFECISFLEDQKLREYATTTSRQAFAKEELMSTAGLYDLIEQKQRSLSKPNKHAAPPNIAQVCRLDATQRADLLQQLANFSDEFDDVSMAALRAGAPPANLRGRGGRGGRQDRGWRRSRRGKKEEAPARDQGQDEPAQNSPRQRRLDRDPNKYCTYCNIPGHDIYACRKRARVGWDGREVIHPSEHQRISGAVGAVGAQENHADAAAQPQPQQRQRATTTPASAQAEQVQLAGLSAQAAGPWTPPTPVLGFDR